MTLNETVNYKFAICNDSVDKNEFLFLCYYCSLLIHSSNINSAVPDDVAAKQCSADAPSNFCCQCHQCSSQTLWPHNTHEVNVIQIERRQIIIKHLLVHDRNVQIAVQILMTVNTTSVNHTVSTTEHPQRSPRVQSDILKALELNKRKYMN